MPPVIGSNDTLSVFVNLIEATVGTDPRSKTRHRCTHGGGDGHDGRDQRPTTGHFGQIYGLARWRAMSRRRAMIKKFQKLLLPRKLATLYSSSQY